MIHGIDLDGICARVECEHGPAWDAFVEDVTAARSRVHDSANFDLIGYLHRADALIKARVGSYIAQTKAAVQTSRLGRSVRRRLLRHDLPRMRADLVTRCWAQFDGMTPTRAARIIAEAAAADAAIDDEFSDLLTEALEEV